MVLMVELVWMKISIQQSFKQIINPKTKSVIKGFTFIEILLVITLFVVLMGYAVPNFLNIFSKPHESEFSHLTSVIKILRNDAILKNNSYCVVFDIKKQKMTTSEEDPLGKCKTEYLTKPKILKPREFQKGLILKEALLSEKNTSSFGNNPNLLEIRINSAGFVTPFLLLFSVKDLSKSWKIESEGIMGKLKLSKY